MLKSFNLIAPTNCLSYGYVAQNLIKAFIKRGIKVNLQTIGPVEVDINAGYDKYIDECNDILDSNSPTLVLWHHFDLGKYKDAVGTTKIGFPIFETDILSPFELEQLNTMDVICVTCEWFKEILENHKFTKPIHIVPLGVDPDIFQIKERDKNDRTIRFLNIGKWELRKSHDLIIKAFSQEFRNEPQGSVSLTLACNNPFLGKENVYWANYAKKHIRQDQLNILPFRLESSIDVSHLINSHDIYCSPSRAEGFNLPLAESLFLNKMCIATNWSAHTSFCNENNCLLLNNKETELMFDGQWFFGNGSWNKVDQTKLQKLMRHAHTEYGNKGEGSDLIKNNVAHLTWDNSVNTFLEYLS